MKFGDKLIKISRGKYQDFYIDYGFLKDFVKDYNVSFELFKDAVDIELKKLNAFVCTMQMHPTFLKRELLTYILYNYIGIFKIFKKYDKLRSKNTKSIFYDIISKQGFYQHYIKHTQSFNTNIRLVVLGHEGVLIHRRHIFGNLVIDLVRRLENVFPDICDVSDDCPTIWRYMGYDDHCRRLSSRSVIVNGDTDDIRNSICDYIINQRKLVVCETESDRREIIKMVRQEWHELAISKKNIKECGNIRALFEFFRMQNIKVAISTFCERKLVEETLPLLNIAVKDTALDNTNVKISNVCNSLHRREPFKIDSLVCGNDMTPCKPSPDALLLICSKTKVSPGQSMLVGDTIADIHAGINARFSRTVGILSGAPGMSEINDATHLVNSIDNLPELFLSLGEEKN